MGGSASGMTSDVNMGNQWPRNPPPAYLPPQISIFYDIFSWGKGDW